MQVTYTNRKDWIHLGKEGPLSLLAQRFVPKLGTDALFDVVL